MDDPNYIALQRKVDAFAEGVATRRARDMQCRKGCAACCEVQLTVCETEARVIRSALRGLSRSALLSLRERVSDHQSKRCVMLDEGGACVIYSARPMVCRTQGLPLRYPAGTLPSPSVLATAEGSEVTWCPLNFQESSPVSEDVLDAERIDVMLGLIDRRALPAGDPEQRRALRELAEEAIAEQH